jgi:Activator of Hsp90 ATPase homolog 1-like protein
MTNTATETRSVVVEREIPFPPEKIWRALTQPHLIEEWLMKNDFKPVVGHSFNLRADWARSIAKSRLSSRTKRCPTRGVPMVWRVSSLGLSPPRAPGPTCAWSSRASEGISSRPTRAPSMDGSGSLRTWSRSWRG